MIMNLFNHFFKNRESAWDMAKRSGVELEPDATPVADDLTKTFLENFNKVSKNGILLFFYFISKLNPTNTIKCSLKKIAKELNFSIKDVKRAVSELESIGICYKVKHATGLYTFVIKN